MIDARRTATGLATVIAVLCGAATAQAAEVVYGVTGGTAPALVRFTSATPGTIESTLPVTGLQAAETVLGIDVRPATGELMALGSTGRLYRVNPGTGGATAIGAAIALNGTRFGIDFNPAVDRLRVVSDAERSYRISPLDGSLVATDTDLAPAGNVVSAAYDRNTPGAPSTLFALDSSANRLVRIGGVDGTPSPNLGAVADVGAVGVDFDPAAGFDVAPSDGTAYASLIAGATTGFYAVDLSSGAATKLADIGAAVIDIAIAQPRLTYYWIASGVSTLVRGHADVPEVELSARITGLAAGETVIGLDQRPATGELVALTNQDRLYVVDPLTANAAQIGTAPLATPLGSVLAGLDFNPTVDRIRVVADNESNLRLNPFTGAIVATDSNLNPAGEVTAAAYTNSFPGATTTALYDIDSASNTLLLQNPPNNGTLTPVGALQSSAAGTPTLDVKSLNGFDIPPAGGFGVLLSWVNGSANVNVLRVNLAAGAVTGGRVVNAGQIPSPGIDATGLAVMSPGLLTAGSTSAGETGTTAKVVVVRSGGRTGPVMVDFATADGSATAGQDYTATSGLLRFADGENAKLVEVPLLDDAAVEGPETFTLTLSRPNGGAVLAPVPATVTITSDDVTAVPPPPPPAGPPPPPPAPPLPPPPAPDRTKPLAFVSATRGQTLRTIRSKGMKLKLVAGEPATATVRATITSAAAKRLELRSRVIATGTATFSAAAVKSLTMTLPAAAKRGIARSRRSLAVTVTATVTDAAKNVSTAGDSAVLPRR